MQPKARMTIRFDPPKPIRPVHSLQAADKPAESPKVDTAIDNVVTAETFTTWNSPYQDDIHALEEIIRNEPKTTFPPPIENTNDWTDHGALAHEYPAEKPLNERWTLPPSPFERSVGNRMSDGVAESVNREPAHARQASPGASQGPARPPAPIAPGSPAQQPARARQAAPGASDGPAWPPDPVAPPNAVSNVPPSWMPDNVRTGPSWWRVIVSVSAAVATGALFGYMVLALFTGEPLFPGKTGAEQRTNANVDTNKAPSSAVTTPVSGTNGEGQTSTAPPASAASEVAGNEFYVLQYGVFKSKESMQSAVDQLKAKHLPFAVDETDGYRVYAGVAPTRDEANLLAAQLTGIEVYVKPLTGSPLTSDEKLSQDVAGFMNAAAELQGKLLQLTLTGLLDKQPQAPLPDDLAALEKSEQNWLAASAAAKQLTGEAEETGATIVQALNAALQSMKQFNRDPSRGELWNVQQNVMQALFADRQLRSALSSSAEG